VISILQTTTRRSRAISRSVSGRRRRGGTFTLAAGTVELDADPTADGLVLRIGGSFRDSRFPTGWLASCAWMFWACESGLILLSVGLGMSRFRFGFGLVFGVVHDDVVVPHRRLLYLIMRHGIDPLLRSRMRVLMVFLKTDGSGWEVIKSHLKNTSGSDFSYLYYARLLPAPTHPSFRG
jgi:hypothetical protein